MQDKRRSSQSGEAAGAGQSSSSPAGDTPAAEEHASGHSTSWGNAAERVALSQGRRRSRHSGEEPAAARAGPVKRASAEGSRLVQAQPAAAGEAQATPPGAGRTPLEDGAASHLQTARPLPGASGLQSGQQLHSSQAGGGLSDDSLQAAAGPIFGAGQLQSGLQAGLQPRGSHASGQLPTWLSPEVLDDMSATSGAERAAASDRVSTHLGHLVGHRPLARSQTFSSGSPLHPLHVRTGFGSPSVGPRVSGDAWSPFSPARSSPKVTVVCRICEEKVGPLSVVHTAVEMHSMARRMLCCIQQDA